MNWFDKNSYGCACFSWIKFLYQSLKLVENTYVHNNSCVETIKPKINAGKALGYTV